MACKAHFHLASACFWVASYFSIILFAPSDPPFTHLEHSALVPHLYASAHMWVLFLVYTSTHPILFNLHALVCQFMCNEWSEEEMNLLNIYTLLKITLSLKHTSKILDIVVVKLQKKAVSNSVALLPSAGRWFPCQVHVT